jgi:hypothetical protein
METYPLLDQNDHNRPYAFEVDNCYISLGTISKLLATVDGVTNVQRKSRFGSPEDVRIEFNYQGYSYIVFEPWGDSSRYWIGPKISEENAGPVGDVERVFKRYHPPFYRTLVGDILTLRILKRIARRK